MPLNHCTQIFTHGLSVLNWVTGKEHQEICAILLGLVVDLPIPSCRLTQFSQLNPTHQQSAQVVATVYAILDFFYLVQLSVHSTDTLQAMKDALKQFHENKSIFINLKI
jgi:hypothetical protein